MIDKKILEDMGFRLAEGCDHEVWYHDSNFWVHYGKEVEACTYEVSGDLVMKEFFEKFLFNFESEIDSKYEFTR
jgi:hypothetical protein